MIFFINELRFPLALFLTFLSYSTLSQDVRGFMVEIDHQQSYISIQSLFYSKNNTAEEHQQIEKGLAFWNVNSDKYMYQLPNGKCYSVIFDLRYPDGEYNESGMFLPSLEEEHAILNQVEILADSLLNRRNHDPNRIIAGYSPNNFVYVGQSYYDMESVWIHEIGHRIGATHRHGIMSETIAWSKSKITTGTVRELLSHAGISSPVFPFLADTHNHKHKHSEIQPARIKHIGDMPSNFFEGGKLKKHSKRRSKCTDQNIPYAAQSLD
ncbi:MAG: hypothetical protein AAF587_33535 [Bacteroidota bacterium]